MFANSAPKTITYNNCLITVADRNGQLIATITPPDRSIMVNLPPADSWEDAIDKAQAYLDATETLSINI